MSKIEIRSIEEGFQFNRECKVKYEKQSNKPK